MKKTILTLPALTFIFTLSLLPSTSFSTDPPIGQYYAGYLAATNIDSPQIGSVTDVIGSWTVPLVNNPPGTKVGIWVGIDGFGATNSYLMQTGIAACVDSSGHTTYYAWYEMVPNDAVNLNTTLYKVSPGDVITAEVEYQGNDAFCLSISDATQAWNFSTIQTQEGTFRGYADWLIEGHTDSQNPIPDFGTVQWTECLATLNGITGPIDSASWQNDELTMTDTNRRVWAKPTGLFSDLKSFNVVTIDTTILPANVAMNVGQSANFSSTAFSPFAVITRQWYLNGSPVSGATGPSWTFTPSSGGRYSVYLVLTDTYQKSATSNSASVTVSAPPFKPSKPSGRTSGDIGINYTYSTSATDPNGDSIRYEFNWADGTTTMTGYYASGANASATHSWSSSGGFFIVVKAQDSQGMNSSLSEPLGVSIGTPPSGGGGCPYIYTWNGKEYIIDNNILPTSERNNGTDVNDYYKLEQSLAQTDGKYSLIISEFEHEHSYIDQVQLLAVDHDSDAKITVGPNGQILTYKNPNAPKSAVDNYGANRLNTIRYMDGDVSNPATFFYGNTSDYLILNFGRISSDKAKLILRADQKCPECCIDIQVLNSAGQWQAVTTIAPRSYWSVEGVDLSAYVIRNRDFKVRLVWTSPHKLDYAGLDTTRQADYQVTYANLISGTHSTQGDVTSLVTTNDNQYAELTPGQVILLDFTLPDNQQEARTYILYTEGHYTTIP